MRLPESDIKLRELCIRLNMIFYTGQGQIITIKTAHGVNVFLVLDSNSFCCDGGRLLIGEGDTSKDMRLHEIVPCPCNGGAMVDGGSKAISALGWADESAEVFNRQQQPPG